MAALNFEKVRYKNLLSSGNTFTEIILNDKRSTLIVGDNGSGKSTLLDAIVFALYGKPFRRINKPQLVNSINGRDLVVEIEFTVNKNHYLVRRGMSPSIFEIYKNNKLVEQDTKMKDYQGYLENDILKMNIKSFIQIVIVGMAGFVPFMQLTTGARRDFIDDLLDLSVFTEMHVILKERLSTNKDELKDIKYDIDLTKERILAAKKHTETLESVRKEAFEEAQNKIKAELINIENYTKILEEKESELIPLSKKFKEQSENYSSQMSDVVRAITELTSDQKSLNRDIKFFKHHDECPTCSQNIDQEFKYKKIEEVESKYLTNASELSILEKNRDDVRANIDALNELEKEISDINSDIMEYKTNIKYSKSNLVKLKNDANNLKTVSKTVDKEDVKALEKKLESKEKIREDLLKNRALLESILPMLKDGGIKSQIIKQYVPIMNKLINKYLSSMDFFVDFQLNENFEETIKSRYRDDFTYASFSEGEKAKIDLALLMAWRTVSKLRNSVSTNLLIMDEVFDGSLDTDGATAFMDILTSVPDNTNIFVISHTKAEMFRDRFEDMLEFKKVKNYSTITRTNK